GLEGDRPMPARRRLDRVDTSPARERHREDRTQRSRAGTQEKRAPPMLVVIDDEPRRILDEHVPLPVLIPLPRPDRRKLVHHRIDRPRLASRQLQHHPPATRPPPRTPIRPTPIRKRRQRRIEHETRTSPCEGAGPRGGVTPSDYRGANAAPP